jgi:hypothetical protein
MEAGSSAARLAAVPRNDEEVARLLDSKPPGWEHLLFAGAMYINIKKLDSSYDDYVLGYAPRLGSVVSRNDFPDFLKSQLSELETMIGFLNKLLGDGSMEHVLGPPGVEGEPDKIFHGASRIVRLYSDMLSWAAHIRGQAMPSEERELAETLVKFAHQPIEELRDFAFRFAAKIDELPAYIARGDQLVINETVRFTIPDAIYQEFSASLDQYKQNR